MIKIALIKIKEEIMNNQSIEEMLLQILEFKKSNPDDFAYIWAIFNKQWGWLTLPSGKEVYVSPPAVSAEEAGEALRNVFVKMSKDKE